MRDEILYGDCLTRLKDVPEGSVQTCVTSPPYYGLRDYGTRQWFDGDPACEHDKNVEHGPFHPGQVEQTKWKTAEAAGKGGTATTSSCSKCGAWWGQLGLEPTPEAYVKHLVEIFREVRRVLRDDGTLWLNLGDSYANDTKWGTGIGPKNLIGTPWMTAFSLRADGWTLRSDIIWDKPNCMPESVEDRPTRSHEYVFLLTKKPDYYYNGEAIQESLKALGFGQDEGVKTTRVAIPKSYPISDMFEFMNGRGTLEEPVEDQIDVRGSRNKRSVWSINTEPYRGAHFAVMAPRLVTTCIKAGSKPGDIVLDPFAGSGTTLAIAKDLDRDFIGIELNETYRLLIEGRTKPAIARAGDRANVRALTMGGT
jgi:DNA modification methylase